MVGLPLRPGEIVRIRDERWIVTRCVPQSGGALLDVRGQDRGNRGSRASFLLPCEPYERVFQSNTPRIVRPRTWWRRVRAALAETTPAPDGLRTIPRASLTVLPFQLEPAIAIARGVASRILIADEVGLGKTVQACLTINETLARRPDAHILVVTPAGLRAQWCEELRTRFELNAMMLDSIALARHGWMSGGNPWSTSPLIVTSLDFVKRGEVLRSLEALVWDLLILDEAHTLAGQSDRATAARALAERARAVLLLTATPHSGDERAFARLCDTGDLRDAFPLLVFRRTRDQVGIGSARHTLSLRIRPTSAELEMHRAIMIYIRLIWTQNGSASHGARLAAALLCRRACSSPASLARSLERRLALLTRSDSDGLLQPTLPFDELASDDDEPAAALATPGLHDGGEERRWLDRLLQLARRAAASESKVQALVRLLRRARQPAIVFTEYRDTLATLAAALSHQSPVLLHGGLTPGDRHASIQHFARGDATLLLATDAASEGLNLHHHCRLVINLELPWTPVRLEQRIGRVERIGQTRRVHAIHLLAAGTAEVDSVARLLVRTARVAKALNELRPETLSESDIAGVVIGGSSPAQVINRRQSPVTPWSQRTLVRDLRADANSEAARLELARSITANADHPQSDVRPCVTTLRRRGGRSYWIYRQSFVDRELNAMWETLAAVAMRTPGGTRRSANVRDSIAAAHARLTETLDRERELALERLLIASRAPLALARQREEAIVAMLVRGRARLSAALLQRGLFDRRNERAAAAQSAVVEEALARCRTRLEELDRNEHVASEPATLAFALLRR